MATKTITTPTEPRTTKEYDERLKALYLGARKDVQAVQVPPVRVIRVEGNEPPGSEQYQQAIAVLYGIAYTLKMGLKFGQLAEPPGYFDYKVGALETLWWSTAKRFEITDAATLRWQAYLMVPGFVTRKLFNAARKLAQAKKPDVPYERATLATFHEGPAVQMLHVGPYDRELHTVQALHDYVAEHGLVVRGKHHEIYLSDPGRTAPTKLKTVIRLPVKRGRPKKQVPAVPRHTGGTRRSRRSQPASATRAPSSTSPAG
jgi:hypothetical protein